MHTFKKTSFVLLYITFFLTPICAQKKENFIKIEPYAGFTNGTLEEMLYYSFPSDKKISLHSKTYGLIKKNLARAGTARKRPPWRMEPKAELCRDG